MIKASAVKPGTWASAKPKGRDLGALYALVAHCTLSLQG